MFSGKIKIGNTLLILLVLYLLGYTHTFGGPYGLAKFFFIFILAGILIFFILMFSFLNFLKRRFFKETPRISKEENIRVDATIVE